MRKTLTACCQYYTQARAPGRLIPFAFSRVNIAVHGWIGRYHIIITLQEEGRQSMEIKMDEIKIIVMILMCVPVY